MGELAVKAICDNIINDAKIKANEIINEANEKASVILDKAQKKADNYGKEIMEKAADAFNAEKKRLISAEKMSAKKAILSAKQEIIENILSSVKAYIEALSDDSYKRLLLNLLSRSTGEMACTEQIKVCLPKRAKTLLTDKEIRKITDKKKLLEVAYLDDLTLGVIVISKNIELTNSIDEYIREEKDKLSDLICNIILREE